MIQYTEKYHSHLYYSFGFFCFALFVLQRIPEFSLRVGTATPLLLLPAVMVTACFLREWTGFWAGLLCGIALDTVINGSACFHTFGLAVFGLCFGLMFRFFFNRNIKSVILLGGIGSFVFFLVRWFFLTLLSKDFSAGALLLRYDLPSAFYTALFVIPFFYYMRHLCRKYVIVQ